jgi:hypothetical protein
MRWPWTKAPGAVYELSDEQVVRWREGDQTVWNEDRKGRPLPPRAVARRDRAEARAEKQLGLRDAEWEAEAG